MNRVSWSTTLPIVDQGHHSQTGKRMLPIDQRGRTLPGCIELVYLILCVSIELGIISQDLFSQHSIFAHPICALVSPRNYHKAVCALTRAGSSRLGRTSLVSRGGSPGPWARRHREHSVMFSEAFIFF